MSELWNLFHPPAPVIYIRPQRVELRVLVYKTRPQNRRGQDALMDPVGVAPTRGITPIGLQPILALYETKDPLFRAT
jgi:hypothetical protein